MSFQTASRVARVPFVEFDVHVTSDLVPVIFHDHVVPVNGNKSPLALQSLLSSEFLDITPETRFQHDVSRSRSREDIPRFADDTDTKLFRHRAAPPSIMKRTTSRSSDDLSDILEKWDHSLDDCNSPAPEQIVLHDGFTTLEETLDKVPIDTGFIVEIKYPSDSFRRENTALAPHTGWHKRDTVINMILQQLFARTHENRRIVIISFDPDVCAMVAFKQCRFPVMLLCHAETSNWNVPDPDYENTDTRITSIASAMQFAHAAKLNGVILCAEAVIKRAAEVTALARQFDLVLATYGEQNMNPEHIMLQCRSGLSAVIVDNPLQLQDLQVTQSEHFWDRENEIAST